MLRLALVVTYLIAYVIFFYQSREFFHVCCYLFLTLVIMMVIVTIVCRVSVMLLFFWFSSSGCVSAMSHFRSGILLVGTAFLPSLVFSTCSSSYRLQTFSVNNLIFDLSRFQGVFFYVSVLTSLQTKFVLTYLHFFQHKSCIHHKHL